MVPVRRAGYTPNYLSNLLEKTRQRIETSQHLLARSDQVIARVRTLAIQDGEGRASAAGKSSKSASTS